jgi:hypothetical protein
MIETRRLSWGGGFNAVHLFFYYLSRLVPYVFPRRAIAASIAAWVNLRDNERRRRRGSWQPDNVVESAVASVTRTGYAWLPPVLSQSEIGNIREYLADKLAVGGGQEQLVDDPTRGISGAYYPLPVILQCPHIVSMMNRADLLRIAELYLGCRPTISGIGLRWSFPTDADETGTQRFHRDADDWRLIKLFVYLTDVEDGDGPHEFVKNSHRTSGRFRLTPYSDREIDEDYGGDSIVRQVGPRGSSFIEDTWGIHKGRRPVKRARLLLDIEYSICPVQMFDYRPVPLPDGHCYDRHANRLLIR